MNVIYKSYFKTIFWKSSLNYLSNLYFCNTSSKFWKFGLPLGLRKLPSHYSLAHLGWLSLEINKPKTQKNSSKQESVSHWLQKFKELPTLTFSKIFSLFLIAFKFQFGVIRHNIKSPLSIRKIISKWKCKKTSSKNGNWKSIMIFSW